VPLRTVRERVRVFLTRFEPDPQFIVQPLYRIFVSGEVGAPGVYEHGPGVTVTEVVALAGGASEAARRDQVRVLREAGVVTVDITRPDLPQAQIPIRSGDQVIVDRRSGTSFGSIMRNVVVPLASITTVVLTIINLSK
jgi:protein involved in polysaccharide export with SLBB domain